MGGLDGLGGRAGGQETTSGDWDGLGGREPQPFFCQGEGRGFESRRPLQSSQVRAAVVAVGGLQVAHHAHRIAHQIVDGSADDHVVDGSIRQRSAGSFELRVSLESIPTRTGGATGR